MFEFIKLSNCLLHVDAPEISVVQNLAKLEHLTKLNLANNQIISLDGLSETPSLKYLDVSQNLMCAAMISFIDFF